MPNSAVASYRPGSFVGVTCMFPDISMPGIVMFAVARTVPASTRAPVAERNSSVKALRPLRRVPVGDRSMIDRSPAVTVWTIGSPEDGPELVPDPRVTHRSPRPW